MPATQVLGSMDAVVIVAIAILGFLFVASFVGLMLVCRHRYCRMFDLNVREAVAQRREVGLVNDAEAPNEDFEVELSDVYNNPNLDEILENEKWMDEATGIMPHCIAILKTCHHLTEKLVAMTMGQHRPLKSPDCLGEIITVVKKINPRVDDVVRSMYPPIDPKLIEARCAALLLAVHHLVLVTKQACQMPSSVRWIDSSLAEMDEHLSILREASLASEADSRNGSVSSQTESVQSPILIDDIIEEDLPAPFETHASPV